MALDSLIPEVWSARFLANLFKNFVFGNAINRTYQPDAQVGEIIHIGSIGDVTIGDYTKNTTIGAPEILDSDEVDILINIQKFYNFFIDSIDEAQSIPSIMDQAMAKAAYGMANAVDIAIASLSPLATGKIGTDALPITPTADIMYTTLTETAKILDKANVPTEGRYIIMSADGIKLLKDSGEMLSDTPTGDQVRTYGMFGGAGVMPNGYKGRVANFDIWMSNNTVAGTVSSEIWLAGHADAIAMVDSVNKVEGYSPETLFGDAVKGLYVFGTKMVLPQAAVAIYTDIVK